MNRLTTKRIEEIEFLIAHTLGGNLRVNDVSGMDKIRVSFPGIFQELLNEIYALRETLMWYRQVYKTEAPMLVHDRLENIRQACANDHALDREDVQFLLDRIDHTVQRTVNLRVAMNLIVSTFWKKDRQELMMAAYRQDDENAKL